MPGYGAGVVFVVRVGGLVSLVQSDAPFASYLTPSISDVGGDGAVKASTKGSQLVRLSGAQMGSRALQPVTRVRYGPYDPTNTSPLPAAGRTEGLGLEFVAVDCEVGTDQQQIRCLTAPGAGKGHWWQVRVGNQWSPVFDAQSSYAPPSIIGFEGEGARDASTRGNQVVVVQGANLGPTTGGIDRVFYKAVTVVGPDVAVGNDTASGEIE